MQNMLIWFGKKRITNNLLFKLLISPSLMY